MCKSFIIKIELNTFSVYEEEVPARQPSPTGTRRRNQDRTYEVTTTTESFHRTIHPSGSQPPTTQQQSNGYAGGY
jgi:hypothetical protein